MNLTNFLKSPLESFKTIKVKSISDVLQCDSKPLSIISKDNGEEKTLAALNSILIDLCNYFSVGKGMGAEQVKETSRLLLAKYNRLKIEDLKLFSDNFKAGQYGKSYDRIDGQVILIALDEYFENRVLEAERININKHKEVFDKNENYIIKVGNNFVRSVEEDFEPVEKQELATAYTFSVARLIKKSLSNLSDEKIEIIDISRGLTAANTFFDYLAEHKPELLPQGEKFRRATSDYHIQKQAIMKDDSLNELEKVNKVRALAGIEPLTMEQFLEQHKLK